MPEQLVSIRVKIRGRAPFPKGRQEAATGRSPEAPGPALESGQEARGAGSFKSKAVQGQETLVHVRQATPIQPEGIQEDNKQRSQNQEQEGRERGPGDACVKKVTGSGNRRWPGLAVPKPQRPEDQALRKLYVGNINTATNRAAMQSYFEKSGVVERCYCTTGKETNKNKDYSFVVFRTAATAEKVQRARPHTLMGQVVST